MLYSSHRGLRHSPGIELEGRCKTSALKGIEVSGSFEEGDIAQLTDLVMGEGPLRIWPNDTDASLDKATVCGLLKTRYPEGHEAPYIGFEVILPGEVIERLAQVCLTPFHYLAIRLWTEIDSRVEGTAADSKGRSFLITSFEVFRSVTSERQGISRFL
jgi:hypothetical protein